MIVYFNMFPGKLSNIVEYNVGQVVEVQICKVNDFGILCSLGNGTKGFATYEHIGSKYIYIYIYRYILGSVF